METAGEYLDRLESDHDVLHLANQMIVQLEDGLRFWQKVNKGKIT